MEGSPKAIQTWLLVKERRKGISVNGIREPKEEEDERVRAYLKKAEKTGILTGRDPT